MMMTMITNITIRKYEVVFKIRRNSPFMDRVIFSALRHEMDKEMAFKECETEVKYVQVHLDMLHMAGRKDCLSV